MIPEKGGLVGRGILCEKPFRAAYSLTERGRSPKPVIGAAREWGGEHLAAPEDETID